ncbi:MAG: Dabb family protein, partial [Mameliella sp.]|nr:Dabb family protein [Phaeodactylibacter sp.]
SMHIGTPAGTNRSVVDNSYSFCLIVTFDSKKEHDLYQKEQVHLNFIEQTKGLWSKIQIYDSVR